jgi:hypothetical protein
MLLGNCLSYESNYFNHYQSAIKDTLVIFLTPPLHYLSSKSIREEVQLKKHSKLALQHKKLPDIFKK